MVHPRGAHAREIEVAEQLARQAGAAILQHYGVDFAVQYKDAQSTDPVTQADRDANRIIVDGLSAAFPADAILAEESVDTAARLGTRRLWCVDPLDGTREFVDRNGQFVVMVGLAVDGAAVAGVVYQPTEDLLWWGADGAAFEIRRGGETVPLRTSAKTDPSQATLMVSRSHRSETVSAAAQRLGVQRQMPLGSVGLKMSRIVNGAADAYISTTPRTKEWDACAPDAIVGAAGGRMTDCAGRRLVYNKPDPITPYGLVATNGPLHAAVIAALEPVVRERGW